MMMLLGGAWVPMFLFPSWLQNVTVLVFAAVFGAVALSRFRWEEA
jgi:hypothetical protein